jgi:hypothetical protein
MPYFNLWRQVLTNLLYTEDTYSTGFCLLRSVSGG